MITTEIKTPCCRVTRAVVEIPSPGPSWRNYEPGDITYWIGDRKVGVVEFQHHLTVAHPDWTFGDQQPNEATPGG